VTFSSLFVLTLSVWTWALRLCLRVRPSFFCVILGGKFYGLCLISYTIKAFRFMCLCLSTTFRLEPHSSFLTFNFVCESYTFVILPLCGYFYLYIVASFHLKFVRFTSLWMQLISRPNPGMIFLRAGCFGRETITFAFKHGRKDRGRW